MTVATAKVPRRDVHYDNFQQLLDDAARLVEADAPTTGNWTKGQILEHVARVMECTIDGFPFTVPWPVRAILKVLRIKQRFLKRGIPAGFKLKKPATDVLIPDDVPVVEGLAHLQRAVARLEQETTRAPHPALGYMPREESDRFQLLHAQMHMSFIAEPE